MNKTLSLFAAAAAFVGCTQYLPSVGPDYDAPEFSDVAEPLPDAGQPPEMATDERIVITSDTMQQWWTQFDDPVLTQLLESSVANNLTYKAAQKRLEEAEWVLRGTYSEFLCNIFWNIYCREICATFKRVSSNRSDTIR